MPEKYSPKILEENYNVTRNSRVKEFFKLFIGLIIVVVSLYFIIGVSVNFLVPYLPYSFENRFSGMYKCPKSKHAEKEKIQEIFNKLVSNLDKKAKEINYTLCIMDDKTVNAFAAPGGYIVLFSGLIDKADSDNEIAFVIGHELGHINNRDHLKKLGRSLINMLFLSLISGNDTSSLISSVTDNTENSFSRAQEKASDIFALKLLLKTYNNADGAISFMNRIEKLSKGTKFFHYLSTHPLPENRIEYIKSYLK